MRVGENFPPRPYDKARTARCRCALSTGQAREERGQRYQGDRRGHSHIITCKVALLRIASFRLLLPQLFPILQPLLDLALEAAVDGAVERLARQVVGKIIEPGEALGSVGIVDIARAVAELLHQSGRRI